MNDADTYKALAEAIEALQEVEGIEIIETHIDEMPSEGGHPLDVLMGSVETEEVGHLIVKASDDQPEYPETPSAEDLARESDFESSGQQSE
jgi:hypothetical protein